MTFSYLDYLNDPTPENIKFIHKTCGMTQPQVAEMLGIGLQTYKGWHSNPSNANYRKPNNTSWNLFLYELEARRLGFDDLHHMFKIFKNNV